jgi:hypothetical protein
MYELKFVSPHVLGGSFYKVTLHTGRLYMSTSVDLGRHKTDELRTSVVQPDLGEIDEVKFLFNHVFGGKVEENYSMLMRVTHGPPCVRRLFIAD